MYLLRTCNVVVICCIKSRVHLCASLWKDIHMESDFMQSMEEMRLNTIVCYVNSV